MNIRDKGKVVNLPLEDIKGINKKFVGQIRIWHKLNFKKGRIQGLKGK